MSSPAQKKASTKYRRTLSDKGLARLSIIVPVELKEEFVRAAAQARTEKKRYDEKGA